YLAKKLGFPIIVKPAKLGSSIGIYTANSIEQLLTVIPLAFNYDDKIICEKKLRNARDINCAAYFFNGKVHISKLEECLSENEILTFEDKYSGGEKTVGAKRKCPAEVDQSTAEKIIEYTQRIYLRADFYGIVRFDFLVCENGIFLNEINSVPGSMAYYLFCDKFADFTSLLSDLIEEGKRRFKRESNLITTFKSNVLKGDFKSVKK
ncbi:MAG: hypothetical protein IJW13_06330, partial [Clostridia bacterium]|nr:hypothetical protein [Clostridia bacterium]